MAIEVKVPLLPESVSDATVSTWHKKAGDHVSRDENLVDLETDKVMLEVPSPAEGIIKEILKPSGSTVQAQEILAIIEAGAAAPQPKAEKVEKTEKVEKAGPQVVKTQKRRLVAAGTAEEVEIVEEVEKELSKKDEEQE